MHHKRKRPKNARSGCLMCKGNKCNGAKNARGKGVLGHYGFGKLRDAYHAAVDMNDSE